MGNVFEKLQAARVELQALNLKKGGKNTFSGYDYYELGDFLPHINRIFNERKLCGLISFTPELATLTIVNVEKPDETIQFTSPMAEAKLKAAHEIQNLGAVETYQRRYLYMTALEIVEHDALDATQGKEDGGNQKQGGGPKQNEQRTQQQPQGNANGTPQKEASGNGDGKSQDPEERIKKGRRAYFRLAAPIFKDIGGQEAAKDFGKWWVESRFGVTIDSFNDITLPQLERLYAHVKKSEQGDIMNDYQVCMRERLRPDDVPF